MATTIPLKKDDDPDMTIWMCEQCCSCGKRTRWWTDLISVDRLRGMTLGEMTDLLKEG